MSKFLAIFLATIFLLSSCNTSSESNADSEWDIVVYGGTSAAVAAALQAKRMGKKVIIVSPDQHLGGLSSGGLGFTDTGNKKVIGGIAREFYQNVYKHYDADSTWKWEKREEYGNVGQGTPAIDGANKTQWIFEPHIAESVFENWINENDIEVLRDEWLDRENGVEVVDGVIKSITMLSGKKFVSKVFVDGTYEGDLMAAAGVNYHVGREANAVYGEDWNGVQVGILHHHHHFKFNVSPYTVDGDSTSGVLPHVNPDHPGNYGEGDKKLQAYCFRMCLTDHPENRVPFTRPDNYDSTQYEVLGRVFAGGWKGFFWKFDRIPNKKTDVNNHGPFSFDKIGGNYDYPEASYERRKEIIKEHEDYQKGLIWFVLTDSRVPQDIKDRLNTWGYPKDEYLDNNNWSHQLYIREARRMIGQEVMTENEIMGKKEVNNPIGMGSYTMDSHNTQRYIKPDGFVQNEGDLGVYVLPYKISLGSVLPKKEECKNLVVPAAVSSSHIAFGSIRMEPVFMILGQSAATVASMAIDKGINVQDVAYEEIQEKILADGQVLDYEPSEEEVEKNHKKLKKLNEARLKAANL